MNNQDLLDVIGEARDSYVLSAEQAGQKTARRHSFRKPMFLAAMLAVAMILAGCVAVFVGIQNKKIAQKTVTKKYSDYGKVIEPTEVTRDILAINGAKDSPMQHATREWYEFLQTYDPDHKLMPNTNENNIPDNYYYTYECYTQDMANKLDEIVEKYDLKLLPMEHIAQAWQVDSMFAGLGIDGVTADGAQAEVKCYGSVFHPNGNFSTDMELELTAPDAAWTEAFSARYYYAKDGFFAPNRTSVTWDAYEQWDYVTADGTDVLLVLEARGNGMIFAEGEAASIFISVRPDIPFVHEASDNPSRKALEQIADVFDYQLETTEVDMAAVQAAMDADDKAYEAAHTYEEPVYHNYGEYINSLYWPEIYHYALRDLNGDGQDELLLGYAENGGFDETFTIQDGTVEHYFHLGGNGFLCEDGYVEFYDEDPLSDRIDHSYFQIKGRDLEWIVNLSFQNGKWGFNPNGGYIDEEITEAEAKAIIAKYTRIELEFQSVLSYPMENGETFEQYMRRNDPVLTEAEMVKRCEEWAVERLDSEYHDYTHYAIRDINNDGVLDLLLSEGPDGPVNVESMTRTRWFPMLGGVYLCENGIVEGCSTFSDEGNQRADHLFYTMNGMERTYLDYVRHDLSADTWGEWENGPELTESEAKAILAKYKRIDVGLRPISELVH